MGLPSFVIQRNREAREKRQREAKQSLISELGLAKDVDPDIASAIFANVPDPVTSYRAGKAVRRTYTKQQTADLFTKSYQAELEKIGQPELTEALAAGADPRTVEALKTSLISTYTTPQVRRRGGKAQHRDILKKRREKAVKEQTEAAKGILKSETKIQPELQEIRRRRKVVAEQQASMLRRQTGRRALLSSPTGGSGFFGGYFKG